MPDAAPPVPSLAEEVEKTELKQGLGFFGVYALIITSMVGTSLFFGVSKGVGLAGSASIFSWIILGLVTVYVAACFGELIAMYPSSGGVYEFTKQAYGRFPSFLVGWVSWIVSNVGSAILVVAALEFILPGKGSFFVGGVTISYGMIKLAAAIAIVLFFNAVTYRGIEASGVILVVCAALVLGLLLVVLIPGFSTILASNLTQTTFPVVAVLVTMFFLAESFFGWESASFLAEETEDATRTIPRALVWASATVAVLGVCLALVLIGTYSSAQLANDPNPVLTLARDHFPALVPVFLIGVFITFLSGVVSGVVSSPRLLFALARDRLFIEQCTKVHPVYKSPMNAILFQTVITIVVILFAFGNYLFLLAMLVPLALIMYAAVLLTVPVLRAKKPNHHRPYRVWGGSWLPIVIALFYLSVVIGWFFTTPGALSTVLLIAGFILLAIPIYWFVTVIYNPEVIISVNDDAARISYWFEDIFLPRSVRREILASFGDHLDGKTVLEYGAGVGTLTTDLVTAVGPRGTIIASDLSKSNLAIIRERSESKNIVLIHDEHQVNRVHPDITHADVIYSIGFLGYIQDLRKILREMHQIMPEHGRICFVEYTNFFKILPDPAVVSDLDALRETFRAAGFAVIVKKKPGVLWNYVIIEGIKTDKKIAYV